VIPRAAARDSSSALGLFPGKYLQLSNNIQVYNVNKIMAIIIITITTSSITIIVYINISFIHIITTTMTLSLTD
jgi:hypothetical protein